MKVAKKAVSQHQHPRVIIFLLEWKVFSARKDKVVGKGDESEKIQTRCHAQNQLQFLVFLIFLRLEIGMVTGVRNVGDDPFRPIGLECGVLVSPLISSFGWEEVLW